jgi:hypothetical protein
MRKSEKQPQSSKLPTAMGLQQTWIYRGTNAHIISLYHNRATGQRYALLDFLPIEDSQGFSLSLSMKQNEPDRINFAVESLPSTECYIEIKKASSLGRFQYQCVVAGKLLPELAEVHATSANSPVPEWLSSFEVNVATTTATTVSFGTTTPITYYGLQVVCTKDMTSTFVHRSVILFMYISIKRAYSIFWFTLPSSCLIN